MAKALPQIVLFGDSMTQVGFQWDTRGWGTALANRYARKADVVLRGYYGYSTRWALKLLDKTFPIPSESPPLLVTVFFGVNDAVSPDANLPFHNPHVPLPEYKENLRQIVAHFKKLSHQTRVVLITPPPIAEEKLVNFAKINFGDNSGIPFLKNELHKIYAEECVKVGQEEGLTVINLWSILQEDSEKFLSDGVHLSAEGNAKLFEELVKVIDQPDLASTLNPNDMPWDFPDYLQLGDDPMDTLGKWLASK